MKINVGLRLNFSVPLRMKIRCESCMILLVSGLCLGADCVAFYTEFQIQRSAVAAAELHFRSPLKFRCHGN
jgi:hypothetical protein